MKRLFVLFALLLLPAAVGAQQVTFSMKSLEPGMTRSAVDSMALVALMSVNAEGMDQVIDVEQSERRVYTESILETDGDRVTRKRITVTEAVTRSMQPMQPVTVKSAPVTGKTYLVEHIGDSVAVTAEDGSEAGKEERAYMVKEFSRNSGMQFSGFLDGRMMSVGEELELEDETLKQYFAGLTQGGMSVRSAKMRLLRLGERDGMQTAVFDVDVVLTGSQSIMEMEIVLDGTVEVGVDNLWPMALILKGVVAGAGSHAGASLTMDGDVQLARIASYE